MTLEARALPPPPVAGERGTLTREGCPLAYELHGPRDGAPVLLAQGVGAHGSAWSPQVAALAARGYRCLSWDNRGIGASLPAGPARLTVELLAQDALALLDAQGWRSAHVVGHSLGGCVAQALALAARPRVRSLSLLCTFARGAEATRLTWRMLWVGTRARVGTLASRRRAFLELVLPPAALVGADRDALAARLAPLFGHDLGASPPITDAQLGALSAWDATPRLAELTGLPTLVVSARHDPLSRPEVAAALARAIPGCRHVVLDDLSHGAPVHDPPRVNALLLEHLEAAAGAA